MFIHNFFAFEWNNCLDTNKPLFPPWKSEHSVASTTGLAGSEVTQNANNGVKLTNTQPSRCQTYKSEYIRRPSDFIFSDIEWPSKYLDWRAKYVKFSLKI